MALDTITEEVVRLKTLVDLGKVKLTWDEIAQIAGLDNGEQARNRYRGWKDSNPEFSKVNENNLVLNTIGEDRTITAEQLLDVHKIDRDVWEIARQSIRKWDGYSKIKDQDLRFDNGKITGHIRESGKLNLVELSYIRVELVRKKPVLLAPVLPQLNIGPLAIPTPKDRRLTEHIVIYLPDPHFPYQDEKVLNQVLEFCIVNEPMISHVVWGGDVLDLAELSTFTNLEEPHTTLQEAIYQAGAWLMRFRLALPNAKHIYLEGNHEKRLRIQLKKQLPALYGLKQYSKKEVKFPLISVPTLFQLDQMDIEYREGYPQGEFYWVDGVAYAHGTIYGRFGAGLTKLLKEMNHDTMTGHDHRIQYGSKTIWTADGHEIVTVAITGWLGDINRVPPGRKIYQDWQHAFGVVSYTEQGHRLEVVPVKDDQILWGNQVYR